MSLFSVTSLSYDVPGRRLIRDMNLEIPQGGVTALLGCNGSGKSTLIKLMAGQINPASGQITYGGRDLAAWPSRALARDLAYLPQVTPPAEGMRLRELVALGRYPWRGALGRFRPEDLAAVDRAITRCGLDAMADRLVDTMSGSKRQRGWIAMMLAQGARTLLLDEPTSALDVAHQVEVLGLVQRMCRYEGLTAIVVLHDVNMAARYCDHVVALAQGQILMQGPIRDLMHPAALARIYGLPMQVTRTRDHTVAHPC